MPHRRPEPAGIPIAVPTDDAANAALDGWLRAVVAPRAAAGPPTPARVASAEAALAAERAFYGRQITRLR